MQYSIPQSDPLIIDQSHEARVYGLFAVAMALTVVGVYVGTQFASTLFASGVHLFLLIAELGIVFSAPLWSRRSPLNAVMFGLFPLFSGITITPYIWYISQSYVNGNELLLNALLATVFMVAAAALFARTTSLDLNVMGRFLFLGLFGLIGAGLLQWLVPSLRMNTGFEMAISGIGIVFFAGFVAYDIQRIQQMSRTGESAFLMALNLYLSIFNLMLYVLRFMAVLSGERR